MKSNDSVLKRNFYRRECNFLFFFNEKLREESI